MQVRIVALARTMLLAAIACSLGSCGGEQGGFPAGVAGQLLLAAVRVASFSSPVSNQTTSQAAINQTLRPTDDSRSIKVVVKGGSPQGTDLVFYYDMYFPDGKDGAKRDVFKNPGGVANYVPPEKYAPVAGSSIMPSSTHSSVPARARLGRNGISKMLVSRAPTRSSNNGPIAQGPDGVQIFNDTSVGVNVGAFEYLDPNDLRAYQKGAHDVIVNFFSQGASLIKQNDANDPAANTPLITNVYVFSAQLNPDSSGVIPLTPAQEANADTALLDTLPLTFDVGYIPPEAQSLVLQAEEVNPNGVTQDDIVFQNYVNSGQGFINDGNTPTPKFSSLTLGPVVQSESDATSVGTTMQEPNGFAIHNMKVLVANRQREMLLRAKAYSGPNGTGILLGVTATQDVARVLQATSQEWTSGSESETKVSLTLQGQLELPDGKSPSASSVTNATFVTVPVSATDAGGNAVVLPDNLLPIGSFQYSYQGSATADALSATLQPGVFLASITAPPPSNAAPAVTASYVDGFGITSTWQVPYQFLFGVGSTSSIPLQIQNLPPAATTSFVLVTATDTNSQVEFLYFAPVSAFIGGTKRLINVVNAGAPFSVQAFAYFPTYPPVEYLVSPPVIVSSPVGVKFQTQQLDFQGSGNTEVVQNVLISPNPDAQIGGSGTVNARVSAPADTTGELAGDGDDALTFAVVSPSEITSNLSAYQKLFSQLTASNVFGSASSSDVVTGTATPGVFSVSSPNFYMYTQYAIIEVTFPYVPNEFAGTQPGSTFSRKQYALLTIDPNQGTLGGSIH